MRMKVSRLRGGEWTVFLGSVVLLGAMLLFTWAKIPNPGGEGVIQTSYDGWSALTVVRWLVLATLICGFALAFFQARLRSPAVPVTLSLFTFLIAGITAIALFVRVLIDPPGGVHFGGILGWLSACAIAYGGLRSLREEGLAAEDAPPEIPVVDPR